MYSLWSASLSFVGVVFVLPFNSLLHLFGFRTLAKVSLLGSTYMNDLLQDIDKSQLPGMFTS